MPYPFRRNRPASANPINQASAVSSLSQERAETSAAAERRPAKPPCQPCATVARWDGDDVSTLRNSLRPHAFASPPFERAAGAAAAVGAFPWTGRRLTPPANSVPPPKPVVAKTLSAPSGASVICLPSGAPPDHPGIGNKPRRTAQLNLDGRAGPLEGLQSVLAARAVPDACLDHAVRRCRRHRANRLDALQWW
jgi:hypothetical protein